MVSISTQHLLARTAQLYNVKHRAFSKEEIVRKVNEIKYLSSQKKVPKLTLRKEIVHLENKLQIIFNLEKQIFEHEKKESAKVAAMRKEMAALKERLAQSEDKDLRMKVDRLSHVLGETLAKKSSIEDVALSTKIVKEYQRKDDDKRKKLTLIHALDERLKILKMELADRTELNPTVAEKLNAQIKLIEERLQRFLPRTEVPVEREKVQHKMIFYPPKPEPIRIDTVELERELPLPPPPRMS